MPLKFSLNAEYAAISQEIQHWLAAASSAKNKTQVQMRLTSRLLQYWSASEIHTVCVCVFNIYMDALSMHSKGVSALSGLFSLFVWWLWAGLALLEFRQICTVSRITFF